MRWLHVIRWRRSSWKSTRYSDRTNSMVVLTWMLHRMWWMMHDVRNRISARVIRSHSHWWAVLWRYLRGSTQHRRRNVVDVWVAKIVRMPLNGKWILTLYKHGTYGTTWWTWTTRSGNTSRRPNRSTKVMVRDRRWTSAVPLFEFQVRFLAGTLVDRQINLNSSGFGRKPKQSFKWQQTDTDNKHNWLHTHTRES